MAVIVPSRCRCTMCHCCPSHHRCAAWARVRAWAHGHRRGCPLWRHLAARAPHATAALRGTTCCRPSRHCRTVWARGGQGHGHGCLSLRHHTARCCCPLWCHVLLPIASPPVMSLRVCVHVGADVCHGAVTLCIMPVTLRGQWRSIWAGVLACHRAMEGWYWDVRPVNRA